MPEWRATRPVDVARLNSSVFLAVIRKYEILLAVLTPAYLIGAVLLAHHRLPTLTTAHILAVAIPLFLTGFATHLVLGLLGVMFLVAVGSLVWWRHVFAVGSASAALAALASSALRVVVRLAPRVDPSLLAVLVRREQTTHVAPEHSLLDQLRVALLVAPDAPPVCRLTPHADQAVRTDQSILRRAA